MLYSKQQIINIRKNLELCKPFTKIDIFKYNHSESKEHNLKMCKQFVELKSENLCIAVRPTLLNNNIPDLMILNFDKPMIKEIMKSESDERFEEKDYMGIEKIKVKVK